ncbi:uncharacterized protein LOC134409355 [Elgaria multicarinata webbii]|uniref:uncharacterized protein LOC134409355 n=1 Tax=Elgaria multicarinata webbii TaxID=159646 RepID=UPI002FCD5E2C
MWRESPQGKRGIWLFCQVPVGKVGAIEWKKDGRVAFAGKEQRLSASLSVLSLPDTEASNCGSFTCNASNAIGWKESPVLRLTTADLSTVLGTSFQISASVLVFAAFCGGGILMPLCQPQKLRIRGKAWKWLSIYANGLACLASVLTLVALFLWSYDQGFYASLIFPIILLIHVILITALIVATVAFKLNVLHEVTDKAAQRMLDFTMPGGVVLDTVISSLLMKHICHLQETRCAEPVDLTLVVAGAAGMCFLPFTTIVVIYCIDVKKRTAEDRVSRNENWRQVGANHVNGLSRSSVMENQ